MIERRRVLSASARAAMALTASGVGVTTTVARAATEGSYAGFLRGLRADGLRAGISPRVLDAALALDRPNQHVLDLDRHQPEFTMTWAQYRARVVSNRKIELGRRAYAERTDLLKHIWQRYGVDPRVIVGIWGLESNYGDHIGTFQVTDALATLAYDGRRRDFFRGELLNALRILNNGDVTPERMLGSYAGAMGQPQFMPSSYLRYAVDYTGDGRRDIWTNVADVFASIANYLARSGWVAGEPWGQPVTVTAARPELLGGRSVSRSLGEWMRLGVRRTDGRPFSRIDVRGALVLPDGAGGEAFLVYANFNAIRRYNASDYYALAVGLIGDAVG